MVPTVAVLVAAAALAAAPSQLEYQHKDTRELVALVTDAARLVGTKGEAAFDVLRAPGSRWRRGETYVFVLDPEGRMLVHPDPALEGKNALRLEDVNGKPIIRGLIDAATAAPDKPEGWYHYQWPEPGGLLPRWKSTYVRLVEAPAGKRYIVGAGIYDDRMERAFIVDMVRNAVAQVEKNGEAAFRLFRDAKGPFIAKDAYVFIVDTNGVELVNPAFPNLEGRNLSDLKDAHGKLLVREMLDVVRTRGAGWVEYMWPRPGESIPTQKSTYVSRAKLGETWVLVGCGAYLADAPKARAGRKMTAPELTKLVKDAAALLEREGAAAYADFRKKGTKWFHDDTYLFVWTLDGIRTFHAAEPEGEGQNVSGMKDVNGRPIGQRFLEVAKSPSGEGWVHYQYPEPGSLFPIWKSTFLKRVTFPNGQQHLVGCGIYNMQMNKAFIEDVVNRAAELVASRGAEAFPILRDRTGPFFFMDTYVFVERQDGTEIANAAQPSLEGKNLIGLKDVKGKPMVREYIDAATKRGSAWVTYYWYRPGSNEPARKEAYVRKVQVGDDTYVVGSGLYPEQR